MVEKRDSATINSPTTTWLAGDNMNTWGPKFVRQGGNWLNQGIGDLWKDSPMIDNLRPIGFVIPTIDEWLQEKRT